MISEAKRRNSKRLYIKRVEQHICVSCGKQDERTLQGHIRCEACRAKYYKGKYDPVARASKAEQVERENREKREWYHRLREADCCVDCGRKDKRTVAGRAHCLYCETRRLKWQHEHWDSEHKSKLDKARRAAWAAAGLCSNCGHEKEEPDKKLCCSCRLKERLKRERRKCEQGILPRGKNGLCYQCNRNKPMEGRKLCAECYAKKLTLPQLHRAGGKQKYHNEVDE